MSDAPTPRGEVLERYRQRYASGVFERENSVELYDSFLHRIDAALSLGGLLEAGLRRHSPVQVMDIGCGDAGALGEIRSRYGDRVRTVGVDLVPPEPGRVDRAITGDAAQVELPPGNDLIVSFRTLHEVGMPERMIRRVRDALGPAGKAILSIRVMDAHRDGLSYAGITGRQEREALEGILAEQRCGPVKLHAFGRYLEAEGNLRRPGQEEARLARVRFLAGVDVLLEAPGRDRAID